MSLEPSYVSTSISKQILVRLDRVHRRHKIGIYAGPPGIGKTMTLEHFRDANPGRVAIATLGIGPKGGLGPVAAGRSMLTAIGQVAKNGSIGLYPPTNREAIVADLHNAICDWAGIPVSNRRRGGSGYDVQPLTMIFDEAQYISRDALEFLRFIFDGKTSHTPVRVSMFFIGNAELSLSPLASGKNPFSDSFGDRCFEPEMWNYDHVTDDDIRLVADQVCEIEPAALEAVVAYFRQRRDRSFRRLTDWLDEMVEESGGQQITTTHVGAVLGLA